MLKFVEMGGALDFEDQRCFSDQQKQQRFGLSPMEVSLVLKEIAVLL